MARPTKYRHTHPLTVKTLMRKGCIAEEIGEALGVTRETIYHWRKQYPEFDDAFRAGKMEADAVIEDSLYQRAKGFEYEETKTIAAQDKSGKATVQKIAKVKRYLAPDIRACELWLHNRNPKDWSGSMHQEIRTVEDDANKKEDLNILDLEILSKETLALILRDIEDAEKANDKNELIRKLKPDCKRV